MPILFWLQGVRTVTNQRASARGVGPLVACKPMPVLPPITLRGVTRDSAGAALANVSLEVFDAATGRLVERLQSDGSGNFVTSPVGLGRSYQIDGYKSGAPDLAGTTLNTLQGS